MGDFMNKIDFMVFITVKNANPNGDPINGNRPRENYDGFGEISDVCIKRKIRNRLQDNGENIFVQSDDRCDDGYRSLRERADKNETFKKALKDKNREEAEKAACREWIDVRTFGQVFAFGSEKEGKGVSIGIRGPVSIHPAVSLSPVLVSSTQITKSVNSETKDTKSADTMGMKHRVDFAVYEIRGSINHQLAEKTGFSDEDAQKIKEALRTLFINDCSSARPDGSMEVKRIYWWQHNCQIGQYSSAKVHSSVKVRAKSEKTFPESFEDYEITVESLPGLEPEIIEGI